MLCSLTKVLGGFRGIYAMKSDFHLPISIHQHRGCVTIGYTYALADNSLSTQ